MTKTEHFALNQWEPSDPIRRGDFNNDNAAIDAAIAANAKALSDYRTANDAAVAKKAEQSALESANTALQNNINAAETHITAVEETVKFIRLGCHTAAESNESVTFDLTGVDMSQYTALLVLVSATVGGIYLTLSVNGSGLFSISSGSNTNSAAMAWLMPCGSSLVGFSTLRDSSETVGKGGELAVAWSDITSIGVSGTSRNGVNAALYGIKA